MAIVVKSSIIGTLKGKIGDVVLSTWNGIHVARDVPHKTGRKKSSAKSASREQLFKCVMAFFKKTAPLLQIGYPKTGKDKMGGMNKAVSYHLLHAVSGEYPDYYMDLSKIKFTCPLQLVENAWNAELYAEENGLIGVRWESNPYPRRETQLDDKAYMILYNQHKAALISLVTERDALNKSSIRKDWKAGEEIYGWLFFVSADEKLVSPTEYLGMVKII